MFITEAGFHPGLPSALVRFAASHLDSMERAVTACFLNMGKALPYTEAVDEVAALFRSYRGKVYRDGRWTKDTAFEMRRIDFGGDIGAKRCYSMYFDEMGPLPEVYPSLQEVGFYMSQSHWVTDWFVTPLVWMGARVFPRAVRPLGKLFWWSMGTFHRPPYRVELMVHATGLGGGRPVEVRAAVSHADGYDLTAIPVVATLLQVLDGPARQPGLHMMGYVAEPVRLMADMERMGAAVSVTVG
jgi:saccharopine dehydrogenase (NAD+, L-lysine-forming)